MSIMKQPLLVNGIFNPIPSIRQAGIQLLLSFRYVQSASSKPADFPAPSHPYLHRTDTELIPGYLCPYSLGNAPLPSPFKSGPLPLSSILILTIPLKDIAQIKGQEINNNIDHIRKLLANSKFLTELDG